MSSRMHFVFGMSGAGSLLMALQRLGLREPVRCCTDELNLGPIRPYDVRRRAAYYEDAMLMPHRPPTDRETTRFWRSVATAAEPVVWMSRRRAQEYAGFCELVSRRDDPPFVVDVSDGISSTSTIGNVYTAYTFGLVHQDAIVAQNLPRTARRMTVAERDAARALWARLRDEDAPLRVVDADGRLVSVPETHFDPAIRSHVTEPWRSSAWVVAKTIDNYPGHDTPGDCWLFARIVSLVDDGVLEGEGFDADVVSMQATRVRLPPR
ncbi:MAG: DUF1835 domain-containing protein [Deltaproteobacteria bacterium]|nr:DUF1835 domain-containing protein [Deltaproteobacteria bacterium]